MKANERKDKQGRNTVLKLRYFSGFASIDKPYLSMNIHERIVTRTSFCGVVAPSLCVADKINFDKEYYQ